MNEINNETNDILPVMMYLHGFMSGANGAKQRQLQRQFKGRYRVVAPELDADPDNSLAIINREIEREQPEIIIGTSLGGFMALECDSGNADVVIVNPCLYPRRQLSQWAGEEHTYFCKRLDGVQTYTLTQETLDKYERYDAVGSVKDKTGYVSALCSTADDLLGDSHVKALDGLIAGDYNMVVDDFGHQCKDAGMGHLYELLERVISRRERVGNTPRSLRAFEKMVRERPVSDMPGYYRLTVRSYRPDPRRRVREYVNSLAGGASCEPIMLRERKHHDDHYFYLPGCSYNACIFHPEYADYSSLEEAREAMGQLVGKRNILTFEIRHQPFGQLSSTGTWIEAWMYDARGSLIQKSSCSELHEKKPGLYGKFFGHFPEELPYRKGDIVIVLNRSEILRGAPYRKAVLGVVAEEPCSISDGYKDFRTMIKKRARKGFPINEWSEETDYRGHSDDDYMILTGAFDGDFKNVSFLHPMDILPVRFPLLPEVTEHLEMWHMQYLRAEEKEKQAVLRMARTLESQKHEGISVMGALARKQVFQSFLRLKDRLVSDIDNILADPAKASAVMPLPADKVRLGAYLIWLRDTGHGPDPDDPDEWYAFLRINDAITVCDRPMRMQDILSMYDTSE